MAKNNNNAADGVQNWQEGLATHSKNAWERRAPHVQEISQNDTTIEKFHDGQFVAYLGNNFRTLRNGSVAMTLHVPYEFRHLAMPLIDAVGMPLSVDIQVWKPYDEATERETE